MIYLLAFLGGMILNLMPCVLPVLFLKAMSLQKRSWQYVAGIMSVFFVLGVLATFPGFIWGGQFDHAWFTWAVAAVCFALGLTYLDVWSLPNFGCREAESDFGKGVLTTVLSSACSGPLLGAVFAASLTQPAWKVVTLFLTIGAGLVTPYLLFPRSWIPKPGAWMDSLKKLAGVSMIATSAWLLAGSGWALMVAAVLCTIFGPVQGRRRFALAGVFIIFAVSLSAFTLLSKPYPSKPFHRDTYINGRIHNRIVVVEFTSKFCSTCQMNALTVQSYSVKNCLSKHDAILMQAMLPDTDAECLLKQLGFSSVPVLAIFPGVCDPIAIPDVVSKAQVIDSLEKAHESIEHLYR